MSMCVCVLGGGGGGGGGLKSVEICAVGSEYLCIRSVGPLAIHRAPMPPASKTQI